MNRNGAERQGGVLVIQTAFLGDVVLTTPLLRALKAARPEERLTVLTAPVGRQVLEGLAFVDQVLTFDKRAPARLWAATARLSFRLRQERFSMIIAAQRSLRSGVLARATGASARIGFVGAAGAWAYTARIDWNPREHAVHRYLALGAAAGLDPECADPNPEVAVSNSARRSAAALLATHGVEEHEGLLAIAPGSIWGTKRWTPEGFARVAACAPARGLRAVLLGSADEHALCLQVAGASAGAVVLAGQTTIPEMAAVLARARVLVANDSGTGHVAAAVGIPVLTVFGPTVPEFGYAPYGSRNRIVQHEALDCRPCHRHGPAVCPLGHHRCMREIDPETIEGTLDELLGSVPDANS